jgi:hypothetical protein
MFNHKWNEAKVATHCADTVLFIIALKIITQNNIATCFEWCGIWSFSLQKEYKLQCIKSKCSGKYFNFKKNEVRKQFRTVGLDNEELRD